MELTTATFLLTLLLTIDRISYSQSFNVGTVDAKIFSGPTTEEFGYTVQQMTNHQGKWLLVGAPWSGFSQNRKGDIYKCPVSGSKSSCDRLNLQDSVSIPHVRNIDTNMSLGLTLTRMPAINGLMMCGPLWAQRCGSQDFYPGVCAEISPLFRPQPAFSPAVQACGGPMDVVIVLDGSNSIHPWQPMNDFLMNLIPSLDIGPQSTQVSVIQYGADPRFEFRLNDYKSKEEVLRAASIIQQKHGTYTNTFEAIRYTSQEAFHPNNGARSGAVKVMVVVTDGESHDADKREEVLAECDRQGITRFGIAVLGYYNTNNQDPEKLIAEIKSIASLPTDKFYFDVSDTAALSTIAGTLGNRIFNIEGTGKGDNFKMEMSQVGFSAHYSRKQDVMLMGAVGAYGWSGTVVHKTQSKVDILPFSAFEGTLQDRNHSSLLGYSVTTLSDGSGEYFVAGAPRSNHSGQVIVYTVGGPKKATIVDTERGKQIGSYFGSVLCPLDVDMDGVSDLLLVGAPMFMSELKREQGMVYVFSVTKGILNEQESLSGPNSTENARFGMAISAVRDLDLDGYGDVVVGAPLEDEGRGVLYVYNGLKKSLRTDFSQRIFGSKLDPKLQYFGRSLDSYVDLNDDTIPDITVGAHGKVVQLWSRGLASVTAKASFTPDKINILSKPCVVSGRKVSCFATRLCFSAVFRPRTPIGPIDLSFNLTLDADLQFTRASSRGIFSSNNDRLLPGAVRVLTRPVCQEYKVYIQETLNFVDPVSLRVDIGLRVGDSNPVLDKFSPSAWEFFVPFSKDCGSDDQCVSDLVLSVEKGAEVPSSGPIPVGYNNRGVSFEVTVRNKKENAYNTQVSATFSGNLFYASITAPSDDTLVKCTSTKQTRLVACQVGYPALNKDQEVKFRINFDFNLNQLEKQAKVIFEAKSDSKEDRPADNKVDISLPLQYNAGVILSMKSNIYFYVVGEAHAVVTKVKTPDDIGPEFNFSLKISTDNFPVSLLYLTVALPMTTKAGNPLLYVTRFSADMGGSMSCDARNLVDPLNIGVKSHDASFSKESLRGMKKLDCDSANCKYVKCIIKDALKSDYYVNVTTRIWSGTFASATYQIIELTSSAEIKSSQPDLLTISHNKLPVVVTISKPGETADVPVGVIVGSAIGGLLLLALAVGLLWKFGFFKRKYKQLQRDAGEEMAMNGPDEDDL